MSKNNEHANIMNMSTFKHTQIDDLSGAIKLISQLSNASVPLKLEGGYIAGKRKSDHWKVIELPVNALTIGTVNEIDWGKYVLFAPYLPPKTASILNDCNARYIDSAGNARFIMKDSYIFISGQKPCIKSKANKPSKPIYGQKTALKILYVLMKDRDLLKANYREIMNVAQVSLGSVSAAIARMKDERILYEIEGRLEFLDYKEAVAKWTMMYATILKPSLRVYEYVAEASAQEIVEVTDPMMFKGVWGGEAGGFALTHYLTPTEITLYTSDSGRKEIIHLAKLKAAKSRDGTGTKVSIIEPFWNTDRLPQRATCACPILTYAELLASNDPRLLDTAKRIADLYLGINS